MNVAIFYLFLTLTAANCFPLEEKENAVFLEFKTKHNISYGSITEELHRRSIFATNYKNVLKHNREAAAGLHTYTRDWSGKYADEDPSVLVARLNGLLRRPTITTTTTTTTTTTINNNNNNSTFVLPANVHLPEEIDWRKLGAVTEVKDQGECGSCWAFSAIGTLEGFHFRQTGKLVSLSEQQVVDCTVKRKYGYNAEGCGGGWPSVALQYISDIGGVDTEEAYPYQGEDGECKFNSDTVGATDKGFATIPEGDEEALKTAVATLGPISVGIYATNEFLSYKSGLFYLPHCTSATSIVLNHAVLVVGYGHDETVGMDYWLVKNSQGREWGEEGYIRMARNMNNSCGIASVAVYPVL